MHLLSRMSLLDPVARACDTPGSGLECHSIEEFASD